MFLQDIPKTNLLAIPKVHILPNFLQTAPEVVSITWSSTALGEKPLSCIPM